MSTTAVETTRAICRPEIITDGINFTRNQDVARRDGWYYAGSGIGLARFAWSNSEFRGIPVYQGETGPWLYSRGGVGCPIPGAFRWIGEYYAGEFLSRAMQWQIATCVGGGYGRMFIDGQLVLGHQTEEWAQRLELDGSDPRTWAIVGDLAFAGPNNEYVEMIRRNFDLPADRRVAIIYEYAIPAGAKPIHNLFGSKNGKYNLGNEKGAAVNYRWMECLSQDMCYPDHALVQPNVVRRGEAALLSWRTTTADTIFLDGVDVGRDGRRILSPDTTTTFEFKIGGRVKVETLTVIGS